MIEEKHPESPVKSTENYIPRRVEMGRQELNYTTATGKPPVEIFKNNQTQAPIIEMHEPTMQIPMSEQTRTAITSIQPALPAFYTQTPYSDSPPHSEQKDHLNEKQINLQDSRENFSYLQGNYVHFLSADCEFTTPVGRLRTDIGAIDPQDIIEKRPEIGTILITLRGRYKIYTVIVKYKHFDRLQEENLRIGLHNLHEVLEQEDVKSFRVSKQGELTETLPRRQFIEILKEVFKNNDINVTVCHGNVCVPPQEDREQIIAENHESKIGGHKGVNKTYKRIRERFFWLGIKEQVTEFVRRCNTCQEQKIIRAKTHEPMIITDTPIDTFDKVSLDTVGPLPTTPDGNRHILTMQDNLSKYCIAVPIPDITATTIAHALAKDLISQYGAPKAILTDRGSAFISKLLRKLSKIFGIKQITTSGYRPQSNGSLERSHAVLVDYIRSYADYYDDWDKLLPFAMFSYNTSIHEA